MYSSTAVKVGSPCTFGPPPPESEGDQDLRTPTGSPPLLVTVLWQSLHSVSTQRKVKPRPHWRLVAAIVLHSRRFWRLQSPSVDEA